VEKENRLYIEFMSSIPHSNFKYLAQVLKLSRVLPTSSYVARMQHHATHVVGPFSDNLDHHFWPFTRVAFTSPDYVIE